MADGEVKYVMVREHLLERIRTMSPGDKLPNEPTLCEEYGVSRVTVRRAVEELIRAGRLSREQGRGTFVCEPKYVQQVRESFSNTVQGFYRQQTRLGRSVTTQVLHNRTVRKATAAIALGLTPAHELIEIERLRLVDGRLHQHVVSYLPAQEFHGLLEQDLTEGSLYERLERIFGVAVTRNDIVVRLSRVDDDLAKVLNVPSGDSVLAMDSTVYGDQDRPVMFGVTHHTPENSEISFSIRNQDVSDA